MSQPFPAGDERPGLSSRLARALLLASVLGLSPACSAGSDGSGGAGAAGSGGQGTSGGGGASAGVGGAPNGGASGNTMSGGAAGSAGHAGTGSSGSSSGGGGNASGGTPSCAEPVGEGTAPGTQGVWEDVTPEGIDLNPSSFGNDNFGIQDVLVDPARPSDAYAFVCHQGVWKSTDYGYTWQKVNTGTSGSVIDMGKPWGSNIDSNKCRDPETPPTLYTLNGNAEQGFWKSTDGGVNWTRTELPDNQDAYSISVDPYDGRHLLMGFHEAPGLVESTDGGATWLTLTPGDNGISVYPFFVDTGDPASTRTTWLTMSQMFSAGSFQRTSDAGESWTSVDALQHPHGCAQIHQAGGGLVFAPGKGSAGDGVYKSTDYGETWVRAWDKGSSTIIGTATTLYGFSSWANPGGVDPELRTGAITPGTSYADVDTPAGMTNGPKGSAVTFDGSHYVVIGGNWGAGLWRYLEP